MATVLSAPLISSKVISNLDTYTYTVQSTNPHIVQVTINELPPSAITVTIKQNASTIVTSPSPAAQQQVISLNPTINCTSGDVISIIVASSQQSDEAPNALKGIINIRIGTGN